jgi:phosphopantetheinyl transferase
MDASQTEPYLNNYKIWCVKESIFKLIGGGGIDFKEHIIVEEPLNNIGSVQFLKLHKEETFKYHIITFDKILVSFIVGN